MRPIGEGATNHWIHSWAISFWTMEALSTSPTTFLIILLYFRLANSAIHTNGKLSAFGLWQTMEYSKITQGLLPLIFLYNCGKPCTRVEKASATSETYMQLSLSWTCYGQCRQLHDYNSPTLQSHLKLLDGSYGHLYNIKPL